MSMVKKVTMLSLLAAATYGVVTKIKQKKKEAEKKNLLSVIFKFLGTTLKLIGYKMKSEPRWSWKKPFRMGKLISL